MELNLHANATTTPKTRAYIQRSKKTVAEQAAELGVNETTIRRWRGRNTVQDHSHRPKTLTTSLSAVEEPLVCELRTTLQLPLEDIVEVMRRCVNPKLSRSAGQIERGTLIHLSPEQVAPGPLFSVLFDPRSDNDRHARTLIAWLQKQVGAPLALVA